MTRGELKGRQGSKNAKETNFTKKVFSSHDRNAIHATPRKGVKSLQVFRSKFSRFHGMYSIVKKLTFSRLFWELWEKQLSYAKNCPEIWEVCKIRYFELLQTWQIKLENSWTRKKKDEEFFCICLRSISCYIIHVSKHMFCGKLQQHLSTGILTVICGFWLFGESGQ